MADAVTLAEADDLLPGGEPGLLARHPWVARRPLTVDEYYRMAEAGILTETDRVELIEGELVAMAPIGSGHAGAVNSLTRLLVQAVGDRAVVSVQNPLRLDNFSEPEPDFTLLKPRPDDYAQAHPRPDEVLLAIEVGSSSLRYDREVKRRLYARHGIAEFWIVDVAAGQVEICRHPQGERYEIVLTLGRGDVLEPALLPGVTIPVVAFLR